MAEAVADSQMMLWDLSALRKGLGTGWRVCRICFLLTKSQRGGAVCGHCMETEPPACPCLRSLVAFVACSWQYRLLIQALGFHHLGCFMEHSE